MSRGHVLRAGLLLVVRRALADPRRFGDGDAAVSRSVAGSPALASSRAGRIRGARGAGAAIRVRAASLASGSAAAGGAAPTDAIGIRDAELGAAVGVEAADLALHAAAREQLAAHGGAPGAAAVGVVHAGFAGRLAHRAWRRGRWPLRRRRGGRQCADAFRAIVAAAIGALVAGGSRDRARRALGAPGCAPILLRDACERAALPGERARPADGQAAGGRRPFRHVRSARVDGRTSGIEDVEVGGVAAERGEDRADRRKACHAFRTPHGSPVHLLHQRRTPRPPNACRRTPRRVG